MAGERLATARLESSGIVGDRVCGMHDAETGAIAYPAREKRWNALPQLWSRLDASGGVEVTADGHIWGHPSSPAVQAALTQVFGFATEMRAYASDANPGGATQRYNRNPIHLLTTAALRSLQRLLPGSVIDERRFRPNLLVELPDGESDIPEYDWIGKEIRIGNAVLRGTRPCGRCGFTTLEQFKLPLDLDVLRTLVKTFERNFGIYCDVVVPGEIKVRDSLTVAAAVDAPATAF
jgi:uncharacterized protein YcbX